MGSLTKEIFYTTCFQWRNSKVQSSTQKLEWIGFTFDFSCKIATFKAVTHSLESKITHIQQWQRLIQFSEAFSKNQ